MTTDDPNSNSGTIDSYDHITGTGYVDGIWFHINDVHEGLRQFLRPGLVVNYLLRKGKKERATNLHSNIDLETFEFTGLYDLIGVEGITMTDVQRKISDITDNNGAVLLLGLHQRYPKAIVKKMKRENKHRAIKRYLEESLPDIIVEQHDTFPKKRDDKESSPFLKSFCGTFFLLRKPSTSLHCKFSDVSDIVVSGIYEQIAREHRNSWVILGDETGDLNEFKGLDPTNHVATMCWIAVPPNTNLPPLNPDFHVAQDSFERGRECLMQASNNLLNNPEVIMFQFQFASGSEIQDVPAESAQVHLTFWKDTLPLVLNHVANLTKDPTNVKIFIENVGSLHAGTNPIIALLPTWKKGMGKAWENLVIDDIKILSKNPLEHPWLGYPDALGFFNAGKKWGESEVQKTIQALEPIVIVTPYRQTALERINGIFTTPHTAYDFVKKMFDFSQRDQKEYISKFFGHLLRKQVSSLNQRDWRNLLEHMENNSETLQSQNAIDVIFEHCDFEQTLEMLTTDSYKFNFLMAVLGSSNHSGNTKKSQTCKLLIDGLFEAGFEPESHRLRHYNNLANGANDNEFDFELDMDDVGDLLREFEEENALEIKINRKLAGAYAMTLALKGTMETLEIAWGLEEIIREYAEDSDPGGEDYARRLNLQAELLLAMEHHEQARIHIETVIPEKTEQDLLKLIETDGFLLAALMKACVLTSQGPSKYKVYSSFVSALLNHRHPSQRIAYWTARWAWQLGLKNDEIARHSTIHLLMLCREDFFRKEAPGIILSCELLDLKHLGAIDADVEQFHSNVLAASTETTRQWVSKHPPNNEDWLSPLNFNYR
jgi:cold shock CspA family protein